TSPSGLRGRPSAESGARETNRTHSSTAAPNASSLVMLASTVCGPHGSPCVARNTRPPTRNPAKIAARAPPTASPAPHAGGGRGGVGGGGSSVTRRASGPWDGHPRAPRFPGCRGNRGYHPAPFDAAPDVRAWWDAPSRCVGGGDGGGPPRRRGTPRVPPEQGGAGRTHRRHHPRRRPRRPPAPRRRRGVRRVPPPGAGAAAAAHGVRVRAGGG